MGLITSSQQQPARYLYFSHLCLLRCRNVLLSLQQYDKMFTAVIMRLSRQIGSGFTGCLYLLEILEVYRNLKSILEILEINWNLIAPPGNFV